MAALGGTVGGGFQADGGAKEPKGLPIIVGRSWSLQPLLDEPMASKKIVMEYATPSAFQ